jgi:hypothetical protein
MVVGAARQRSTRGARSLGPNRCADRFGDALALTRRHHALRESVGDLNIESFAKCEAPHTSDPDNRVRLRPVPR